MENIESPYTQQELDNVEFKANMKFLNALEDEVKDHAVFNHPFLENLGAGKYGMQGAVFTMIQIAKMVKPFTAAICALMGRSSDLKSRYVLFDNLYEEMGRGRFEQAHPSLYMNMLVSMGISEEFVDNTPTITSIRLLNDAIFDAILRKPFGVGCAWLGYGGELTIPNNFPYLVRGMLKAFKRDELDMSFWERHGERDQGHSDDATTLLAMNISEADYATIREEIYNSLALRKMIWDECEQLCEQGLPGFELPISEHSPVRMAV